MRISQRITRLLWFSFFVTWEQRKFESLAETRRGLTYNPSNISPHGIRVLRSSNINEDTFVLSDDDIFVCPDAVKIECAKPNDILITAANGSTRLVGKHAIIVGIRENKAVHGGFMLVASSSMPFFLNAAMSAPWYLKFINLFVAGGNGAIGNLNKNDLDNQLLFVPKNAEQEQIGEFFRNFDNLITLHQRKQNWQDLQFLRKKLSSFLAIAWEQRKLGECGDFTSNGVDKLRKPKEIPVSLLNYMDVYNRRHITAKTCIELMQVTARPAQIKNNDVRAGDVLFTPTSETAEDIGHSLVVEENLPNTVYSYHLMRYRPHGGVFFKTYPNFGFDTKYLHDQMTVKAKGVQRFVISKPDFEELQIICPSYREQESIASFLTMLDNLITLHQCGENIDNRRQ